jgi:uncharacterized protein with FMN-binding domain
MGPVSMTLPIANISGAHRSSFAADSIPQYRVVARCGQSPGARITNKTLENQTSRSDMPDHQTEQAARKTRNRLLLSAALIIVYGAAPANAAPGTAHYSDGEFIGKTTDTIWGDLQVKAIIRNGAILDVQFLQYPSHRRRSELISSWALPILRSEAIRAQSAQVDIVSQASITSEGFQETLASALKQATK